MASSGTTITISRRGSIDVRIPPDERTAGDGLSSADAETIHIPSSFAQSSMSAPPLPASYRERAIQAIKSTLSPGSEFSFGNSSGEHSESSNSRKSASENTDWRSKSKFVPAPNDAPVVAQASRGSIHGTGFGIRATAPTRRVSGGIQYVSGVKRPTVDALERLENALLRTSSLIDNPKARAGADEDSRAAIREIAFLRNMQQQLSAASLKLHSTGPGVSAMGGAQNTHPVPSAATSISQSVAAQVSAVAPEKIELDRTLERLHQAATREGVLRMENIRLRQQAAAATPGRGCGKSSSKIRGGGKGKGQEEDRVCCICRITPLRWRRFRHVHGTETL